MFGVEEGGAEGDAEEDDEEDAEGEPLFGADAADDFESILETSTYAPSDATSSRGDDSSMWEGEDTNTDGLMLCIVCEIGVQAKLTSFCQACGVDARQCRKDARNGGPQAMELSNAAKKDPMKMKVLILDYKSRCRGQGRGHCQPGFDWSRTIKVRRHHLKYRMAVCSFG